MSVYKRRFKRPGDNEFSVEQEYSFDFRYRGNRFSGKTGCNSKREAKRFEDAEKEQAKALVTVNGAPMTFNAAATRYWEEVGKFLSNAADTFRDIAWLERQLGRATMLSTISSSEIAKAIAKRRAVVKRRGGYAANGTVNRQVTFLIRAILNRAENVWEQPVKKIKWKEVTLEEPQEIVREATPDEESALFEAIRDDYADAIDFAIMTGCRLAEIIGLTWPKVNFFTREFTVTGKRDRTRVVPMTGESEALLRKMRPNHVLHVFTYVAEKARDGRARGMRYPMTYNGLKTAYRRSKAKSGVKDLRFHDLRHTAATRTLRAAGDLKMVQQLLGHKDIATTAKYAHVLTDDIRRGLEAASATRSATRNTKVGGKILQIKGNLS